jgi:nicotinate dehydrogenase subunit B
VISVCGAPDQRIGYGELRVGQPFARPVIWRAALKRPQDYRVVGSDEGAVRDAWAIRLGNFIGVMAERKEQAIKAAVQLQMTWEETRDLPLMEHLYDWMRAQATTDSVIAETGVCGVRAAPRSKTGACCLRAALPGARSIGPSCAVA